MDANNTALDLTYFPKSEYTPFGYLDNPYHTAIINRSGIIRSVPPIGFGFWAVDLPWPYASGLGLKRYPNYLSFLHLSIQCGELLLHQSNDFKENNIKLFSKYHTKSMMSYDFSIEGMQVSAWYFLEGENSIICKIYLQNKSDINKSLIINSTNIYGFVQEDYWGADGLTSSFNEKEDCGISKVWAYGDIFIIGSDKRSANFNATDSSSDWQKFVAGKNNLSQKNLTLHFNTNQNNKEDSKDHIYTTLSYEFDIPAGDGETMVLSLTRGKNQISALNEYQRVLKKPNEILEATLEPDKLFYKRFTMLEGDWPTAWKHGWVYDFETIRMNIRPPIGIYKHHWDAMQVHSPRSVLGEAALDAMTLSYVDIDLAKEVIYGTFADAPMPNVPCSREDGSMNMISAHGKECGTAPIWGMPFMVIFSIYQRCGDLDWIKSLYPYLQEYLEWWIEYRKDEDGWFFAACSWESGQDASKRFLVADHDPGAASEFIRTVDITSAMGHAFSTMGYFAELLNDNVAIGYWNGLASDQLKNISSMFIDGWYRDIDGRTDEPIILKDYFDVMMFTPVAFNMANSDEIGQLTPMFNYFKDNQRHWLEWPSFMQVFSEAAWYAGNRKYISDLVADIADRIYNHIDKNNVLPVGHHQSRLPKEYNYRIPGVSNEYWPIDLNNGNPGGCENYGWGATMPVLIIRNIIGFRELENKTKKGFSLSPSVPNYLCISGRTYGISKINFQELNFSISYTIGGSNAIEVEIKFSKNIQDKIVLEDEKGNELSLLQNDDTIKIKVENYQSFNIYL